MSKNARCSMPGNSGVRCASAARCSRATAASWLACPKVNSRKKIPSVEGAYTSSNTRGVPPARNTFTSSMLSAPHIMPPMIVVSFPAALTAPGGHPRAGQVDMLADQPRKTGLLSQFQHRHQTSRRHQIRLVKHRRPDCERYAMIAPEMPSETGTISTSAIDIVPVQEAFSLFTRRSPTTDRPRIQA